MRNSAIFGLILVVLSVFFTVVVVEFCTAPHATRCNRSSWFFSPSSENRAVIEENDNHDHTILYILLAVGVCGVLTGVYKIITADKPPTDSLTKAEVSTTELSQQTTVGGASASNQTSAYSKMAAPITENPADFLSLFGIPRSECEILISENLKDCLSRGNTQRGGDLSHEMEITLEEAFKGKDAPVKVSTWQSCADCSGSGAERGTKPETCVTCHGAGRVRALQGFFMVERTCPSCSGTGPMIKTPCHVCIGQGRVRKKKSLHVSIPAGIEDGTRIRLAGEGEAGVRGGPTGDLYVFLSVKPHRFFQRDGANLHCSVPVPIHIVVSGGEVEVPTIDDKCIKMIVPAGTQAGTQFRLKGRGMSVIRSSQRGDFYVECVVETPAPDESAVGPMANSKISDLEKKLAETRDRMLCALAEAQNIRARAEKERQDAARFALSTLYNDLIPVAGNLRRALTSVMPDVREKDTELNNILIGIERTERVLLRILERRKAESVEA